MSGDARVYVVDDDAAFRESLERLLTSSGLKAESCGSAQEFLRRYDRGVPSCLLLDINMPQMNGLELQARLNGLAIRVPVIIISAHADVENAVRAIKAGAIDFLRKPFKPAVLLERIAEALARDRQRRAAETERTEVAARLAQLTPREREVFDSLVAGLSPKEIAHALGLSRKTVDVHRGHIATKLNADSLLDLVRLAQKIDAATD